jgi:hypothetical protein
MIETLLALGLKAGITKMIAILAGPGPTAFRLGWKLSELQDELSPSSSVSALRQPGHPTNH